MLLVYLAVAWAAGIAVATSLSLPITIWAWWLVMPLGFLLIWWRDPLLRRVHLCLLVFLLGAIRYTVALPQFDENSLVRFNDRGAMLIVGTVVDYPDVRDRSTHIRLAVTHVRIENTWHEGSGLALAQVPRDSDVRYGDQVQIYGEPATPPEFEDFSYKEYLARQGIHSLVRVYGGVKVLARDQGSPFFAALYAFRDRALATIHAIFPEPAGALLAGILLGIDSGIPREVLDAFNITNTAHVIAISGFNISVLVGIFTALASRLFSTRHATFVVLLGLVVYTLLVGASPSVLRAAIMGSLTVIAGHWHRQSNALNALAAAALLLLAWNPSFLYDISFQLSFLATLGLIWYVPPLTNMFERFIARFTSSERTKQVVGMLNDALIVTLAAQITTTPLIVFAFHRLSLVGLLTNLIILPIQPWVIIWGGAATLVAMVVQPVGQIIAWVAWAFTEFTIVFVQATADLPFAAIQVGHFDALILAAYYVVLLAAARVDWRALCAHVSLRPTIALGVALVVGVWLWNLALTAPDGKTHVEFLDAGGPAVLVRTPRGARVLIDGGAEPSVVLSALGERMPFWDRTVDLLVLTNADDDHLAGLVGVLERYDVRQIVQVSAPAKPSVAYLKWRDLIAQKRVASVPVQSGLNIALDRDLSLEFLYPPSDTQEPHLAIARLRAGVMTLLLADSAAAEDQAALQKLDVTSTALIAPRSISPPFLDAVNPYYAIVFTGSSARGKPSGELLAALSRATILRTDEHGTIEFVVEGNAVVVRMER